jgi:hypothetical protein
MEYSGMKNSATDRCLTLLLAITAVLVVAPGCSAQGLGRPGVKRMIEESEKFKAPVVAALKVEDDVRLFPQSPEETEEAVRARALRNYLSSSPTLAVLRHLGYVKVDATVVQPYEEKNVRGFPVKSPWVLKIEPTLTEKGKSLAGSQGLPGDRAVVLARREVVEVTGIRERSGQAVADFTWKAIPTEAGKAFDSTSDVFKGLPLELRDALTKSRGIGPFGRSATQGWGQVHMATASFQKYDDGWRLSSISSGLF